jgi:type IV pilus assembly protein PilC
MANFSYIARTKTGAIQKDTITALNEAMAAEFLRAQGLIPSMIKPLASGNIDLLKVFEYFHRIKMLDKITFIKNLSVMIKAGLPVSKSLKILAGQTPNKKFAKIVADIAKQVESGTSLGDAMLKFPNVFSSIFVSMVRVGEASGTLDQNLNYLSEQMQKDYDLVSKAKGALTYPIIVLIALAIVGFLMFTFVLPKLTSTFTDLHTSLPFTTQVVVGLVNIFASYGLFILLFAILAIVGFLYWRKTNSGQKVIHKAILYLPVVSGIVIKINLARFIRVFGSLLKSGMPIVESLEVSSKVVGNIYFQKVISEAAAKVKIGSPLTAAFEKEPRLFSNLVIQMIQVGEESGSTDVVLLEVANFYESELDQTMKNLSSILEPVIMMIIGVVVGFIAVALISPIYNISQSIN